MLEESRVYQWVNALGERLTAYVRGSFLYRWLTAEPEPEVIVIDLRETWTVGPFIALLDRLIEWFGGAMEGSVFVSVGLALANRTLAAPIRMAGFVTLAAALVVALLSVVADRTALLVVVGGLLVVGTLALFETRSWAELRETRPVELLVAAFEPPAPPESGGGDETEGDSENDSR